MASRASRCRSVLCKRGEGKTVMGQEVECLDPTRPRGPPTYYPLPPHL
jgi:hypothetical protein